MPQDGGWDETSSSYRYRVRDPGKFQEGSFRTISMGDSGVKGVVGRLEGQTTMTLQSLIFPKDKFTAQQARKWVSEHPDAVKRRWQETVTQADAKIYKVEDVDEELGVVFGWGYTNAQVTKDGRQPVFDSHNAIIEDIDLERACYDFVAEARGMDQQHDWERAGDLVECAFIDDRKLEAMFPGQPKPYGWRGMWVGFRPHSDEVLQKFKDGEYAMFSIGGTAEIEVIDDA